MQSCILKRLIIQSVSKMKKYSSGNGLLIVSTVPIEAVLQRSEHYGMALKEECKFSSLNRRIEK
ncbi:hypothetical protein QQG55_41905 [Brugia pahangi]